MAHRDRRLGTLVKARRIAILGSEELLGEFVPYAKANPDGYRRILDAFWAFCGKRLLRPWNELIRAEIRKGSRLSLPEALLPEAEVEVIRRLSYDPEVHAEWAERVGQRKADYALSMSEAASEFEAIAKEKWGAAEMRKGAADLTITRSRISDWGRALLIRRDPKRLGLPGDETLWPDVSLLPCASAYIAMTLAWRRKCHEARRRDRGSDFYDSMHYVLAAMCDCLVTADKGLRHAVGMIEWHPVRLLAPEEFERSLAWM